MAKNLDIASQLFKRGAVLLIPQVKFNTGITKAKYAVLLEDADALWKRGRITACLTTSKKFKRFKSWFSIQPATILGLKEGTTTIDTLNRISLTKEQIEKCKYVGQLNEEQWDDVVEAKKFGDWWIKNASETI